jgi:general secretion pathway protein G
MNRTNNKGFTLVEILIVVIILGILAAIVIPQFTQASDDARASALSSDLQTLRSQCELYKFQHGDKYPWQITGVTSDATFWTQLMSKTTITGATTGGTYGPYVQSKPGNAFVTTTGGAYQTVSLTNTADGTCGWAIDTTNHRIRPGDTAHSGL